MTKRLWRKVRAPLAESAFVLDGITVAIGVALRFIYAANRTAKGSHDASAAFDVHAPGIAAFWHGQHILAPCMKPKGAKMAALFSRSRDAELNARVAERFGFEIVRGSGGRDRARTLEKGGIRALLTLKKALDGGTAVAMIADIPHGTPREAGLGIAMLGRISGRPVVPVALATSRRKVIESSWDKTTINLPFGRKAVIVGDPIHVPADADDAELERKRREITAGLNAVTAEAYRLVSARK
ncbi:lysophospholipid acyltransferase family protein [Nitratireductor arenosus]|nr:lysophospholipid acyltransferase family protein [Nitratireductor arenosus]